MLGDAPGDKKAALDNKCHYFPINPGHEEASWKKLHDEALEKFLTGSYCGDYEAALIAAFDGYLPEHPAWPTVS